MTQRSPAIVAPVVTPARAALLLPCLLSLAVSSAWAEGNVAADPP